MRSGPRANHIRHLSLNQISAVVVISPLLENKGEKQIGTLDSSVKINYIVRKPAFLK